MIKDTCIPSRLRFIREHKQLLDKMKDNNAKMSDTEMQILLDDAVTSMTLICKQHYKAYRKRLAGVISHDDAKVREEKDKIRVEESNNCHLCHTI